MIYFLIMKRSRLVALLLGGMGGALLQAAVALFTAQFSPLIP